MVVRVTSRPRFRCLIPTTTLLPRVTFNTHKVLQRPHRSRGTSSRPHSVGKWRRIASEISVDRLGILCVYHLHLLRMLVFTVNEIGNGTVRGHPRDSSNHHRDFESRTSTCFHTHIITLTSRSRNSQTIMPNVSKSREGILLVTSDFLHTHYFTKPCSIPYATVLTNPTSIPSSRNLIILTLCISTSKLSITGIIEKTCII